jgi:hypothetical protein
VTKEIKGLEYCHRVLNRGRSRLVLGMLDVAWAVKNVIEHFALNPMVARLNLATNTGPHVIKHFTAVMY